MMNPGFGMTGGMGGFSLFVTILWVLILVDLALLAVWLWKQINKK